jgi:Forkhead domain
MPSPRLSPSSPTSSAGEPSETLKVSHNYQESKEHVAHPTCPDTLRCLPDTDERPQHTLPVILRCAILGSKMKRLTIREIYASMEEKYPYYRTAGSTWKVSLSSYLISDVRNKNK